jgi:hypothetical protein
LCEETGNQSIVIGRIMAVNQQTDYTWTGSDDIKNGSHLFRVRMIDIHGKDYTGEIVLFKMGSENIRLSWLPAGILGGGGRMLIQSAFADTWEYEIISLNGRPVKKGIIQLSEGKTYLTWSQESISNGIYIFLAFDSTGKRYSLIFKFN